MCKDQDNVYTTWWQEGELKIARSHTRGSHWTDPEVVPGSPIPVFGNRLDTFENLKGRGSAYDIALSSSGRLLAVRLGSDGGAYATGSTDNGRSWSHEVLVSPTVAGAQATGLQLAVDDSDHAHAVWAMGLGGTEGDIFVASSADFGNEWSTRNFDE